MTNIKYFFAQNAYLCTKIHVSLKIYIAYGTLRIRVPGRVPNGTPGRRVEKTALSCALNARRRNGNIFPQHRHTNVLLLRRRTLCAWSIGIPVFCRDANGQVSPRYLRSTSSIFPASSKRVITFMHSEMEFKRITLFVLASFFIIISFFRRRTHRSPPLVKHSISSQPYSPYLEGKSLHTHHHPHL